MKLYAFVAQVLARSRLVLWTRGRALLLAAPIVAAPPAYAIATTGCHLSPKQAQTAEQIAKPLCDLLGGVTTLEIPGLGFVATICQAVADDITEAETVTPADGGVLPVKASPAKIVATPGCVPVAIPGDPLKQRACPELHEQILAASLRVTTRAKAKGLGR